MTASFNTTTMFKLQNKVEYKYTQITAVQPVCYGSQLSFVPQLLEMVC
jgi:hypothetical protein